MLYAFANGVTEDIEDHLANDEEENAKQDVTQRPAVLQSSHYENDLADCVNEQTDGIDEVGDDKDANRVHGAQSGPAFESQEIDRATDDEHGEGAEPQQPDRKGGAVFIKLETDKAINQQASTQGGREAILGGGKIRVGSGTGRSDACIEDERDDGQEEVDVEEGRDFLAPWYTLAKVLLVIMLILRRHTDSGEFGAHVYDHYDGHDQGQDVHKVVSRLEDERIGDLNSPGIAACLDAHAIADILMAHSSAEGYRRLFAYRLEVAEAHCRRTGMPELESAKRWRW